MRISEMMYQLSKPNVLLWNTQILDMEVWGITGTVCLVNRNFEETDRQGILLNSRKMYEMHFLVSQKCCQTIGGKGQCEHHY